MGNVIPNVRDNVISNVLSNVDPLGPDIYGPELVTNGDFTAWTADDPDGWTVTESSPHLVTQNGNAARIVTGGTLVTIVQDVMEIGKGYHYCIEVTDATSGGVDLAQNAVVDTIIALTSVGTFEGTFTATGIDIGVKRKFGTSSDMTFTNLSIREIL